MRGGGGGVVPGDIIYTFRIWVRFNFLPTGVFPAIIEFIILERNKMIVIKMGQLLAANKLLILNH